MKKTIFSLFIINLIIFGSSAISMNINNFNDNLNVITNSNDDKPDFIINYLKLTPCRCPFVYSISVKINNIGAEIKETLVKIKVTLDSNVTVILMNYSNGTGISIVKAVRLNYDRFEKNHTATVEVDPPYNDHPNGDIIELKEDNNIMIKSFITKIKVKDLPCYNIYSILFNHFF